VVFYGVVISVVLTLAVVPAVYTLVARNTSSPQTIARLIERLRGPAAEAAVAPAGGTDPARAE
jgi:multidrug efflux pump